MSQLSFGILLVVLVVVQGYYHDEYYPEARHFKRRKGLRGDDGSPVSYQDVSRPHKWLRLRQRAERIMEDRRRRGYNTPYTRGTAYSGSQKGPRTNTYEQRTEYRNRPKTNTYNQQVAYQKGSKTNVFKPAWQTYIPDFQNTQTFVKGPRTDSRGDEYAGHSETVAETARRFVNARKDYTDRDTRTRPTYNQKNSRNNIKKPANRGQRENEKKRTTEYRQSSRNRNNGQIYRASSTQAPSASTTSGEYEGCKDTGLYCTFWKSIGCCEQPLGRKYCRRKCGFCSPQQTICPSSYEYGCCFDGKEALDLYKSNCRRCLDKAPKICRRPPIMEDCDLHEKNSLRIRSLCPQTCGACFDYTARA